MKSLASEIAMDTKSEWRDELNKFVLSYLIPANTYKDKNSIISGCTFSFAIRRI